MTRKACPREAEQQRENKRLNVKRKDKNITLSLEDTKVKSSLPWNIK
jgi:hypothetical protein